jgi:RNA polymerase sigma-70 factor (ECF subfamily)
MTRDDSRSFPDPANPANADDLLRHAAWLRALARTLVGEADADDVVQETWVAAVAHRPSAVHSLRAWLGAVARNVVRQSARAAARRREREAVAARRDDAPSTDEVVARAAQMRELVERVLALDEPYRTTLLLRFFEGVKPQEIARRVGASEEAVRQRLKRGLDRLREQLDEEHEGRREEWIAGFASLLGRTGAVGKGVVVNVSAKWAVAGALVLAAAGVTLLLRSPSTPRAASAAKLDPTSTSSSTPAATPSGAIERTSLLPGEAAREAAPATQNATASTNPDDPVRFVFGAVVDERGEPLKDVGYQVSMATRDAKDADGKGDPIQGWVMNGTWSAPGLEPGAWHVSAKKTGFESCERDFVVHDDAEGERIDLVLRRSIEIRVRLRAPDGRPLADAVDDAMRGELEEIAILGLSAAPPERFDVSFGGVSGLDGNRRWFARAGTPFRRGPRSEIEVPADVDGVLVATGDPPAFIAATLGHLTLASARVIDPKQRVDLVVDPAQVHGAFASLRLRLIDADSSAPISGGHVALNFGHMAFTWPSPADADGRVALNHLRPGRCELSIDVPGHGAHAFTVNLAAGAAVDLGDLACSLPITLRGRVSRADGEPIGAEAGAVRVLDLDRWRHGLPIGSSNQWMVDRDGGIELPGFGRGRHLVLVSVRGCATESVVVDARSDPAPRFALEVVPGTEVTFHLARPWPLQWPVFELDTSDGVPLDSIGVTSTERLRPGSYRITGWRGESKVVDVPFTVGDAPATVAVPRVDDPSGLTWEEAPVPSRSSVADPSAPKIAFDPVGIVCYGRVRGGASRGLDEAGVSFTDLGHRMGTSPVHRGCFAATGLAPGRIERQFYSRDRLPFVDWIALAAGPNLQRHDYDVAPGSRIEIHLVDASTGKPLDEIPAAVTKDGACPGFAVVATKSPPPVALAVVDPDWNYYTTFENSRFQWQDGSDWRKPGALEVGEPFPVFVSLVCGGRVLHTVPLAAPVASLDLPVDWNAVRATFVGVRFRLVDAASGAPLAATMIMWTQSNVFATPGERGTPIPFDEGDGYLRERLPPGRHKLVIGVPGRARFAAGLDLPTGGVTDLGTIPMGVARTLKGSVVDAQGHPLKASIRVIDLELMERPIPLFDDLGGESSDEQGRFSLQVGRSRVAVMVSADRFAAAGFEVAASPSKLDDLRVVLVPGTPVVIRLLPSDLSREQISVEDDQGLLVSWREMTLGPLRLTLRPGSYVAAVRFRGEELAREEFDVLDQPVEVALER